MAPRKFIIFCVIIGGAILTLCSALPSNNYQQRQKSRFIMKTLAKQQLSESKFRLQRHTAPRLYIIEWDLNILAKKFTFKGNSNIIFEVLRPTAIVTLHRSDKIDIDREFTKIIDESNNTRKPIEQEWLSENEFYLIKFDSKLTIGNYTLKMKWLGRDARTDWWNPFDGLFRIDPSTKDDNQYKYVVTSHFEPTGARNAFPCWDEPGMKAQFEISIIHDANYTALSNMPVKNREELPDGKIRTKFQRSPKMSSYLPCIAVSNYEKIENSYGNITMYGNHHDLEFLKHALEISEKIIPAMEQYTDIPYALPKLDQIAVRQLSSLAMEHWGLVTYIDQGIMFRNTTLIQNTVVQDRVAFLVAHELAHQWFGNLVSPVWWGDIWLNEAFAAYYQYKAADMIFPDWNVMDFYAAEIINHGSFSAELSTGESSKPVRWNPTDKTMIDDIFSSVTYSKGSAIIHMMEHMLGEEVFREGIQCYLKKHQFSAVTTDDLWTSLQVVYDKKNVNKQLLNIKETIDPWLEQKGYPILTVTRDYNTGVTNVSQKMAQTYDVDNKWKIPLTYATKSNPNFTSTAPMMWINQNESNVTIPNIDKDDWIILNIQQRGFYQVNYDYENWRRIADYLNSDKYENIHPVNRAQLIRDVMKLYTKDPKNDNNRKLLGNITAYLHREINLLPWMQSRDILKQFMILVQNTPEEELFTKYCLHLMSKVMDYIGFNDQHENNHETMRTQRHLVLTACQFGHVGCQDPAKNYFDAFLNNPDKSLFPRNDMLWVYCIGLGESNDTIWDMLMSSTLPLPDESLMRYRLQLLKCAKTDDTRNKYFTLATAKNSSFTPIQVNVAFNAFMNGKKNDVDYILKYIIENFNAIDTFFNSRKISRYQRMDSNRLINNLGSKIKSKDQYQMFKEFLDPIIKDSPEDPRHETLQSIHREINNTDKFLAEFHAIFDNRIATANLILNNDSK